MLTKTKLKLILNTHSANDKGRALANPDLVYYKLSLETGSYTKAAGLMFSQYRISVRIGVDSINKPKD